MCEVNFRNLKVLLPEIKKKLEEAKFISIDLEFSALNPLQDQSPSLFDTPAERYYKLKKNLETVTPVQIGLTAFTFDSNRNSYCGRVYTFYVQPACFQFIHRNFYFQSSTISFLRLYNFDFNKFAYEGIPFINRNQEQELREKIKTDELSEINVSCRLELEEILAREGQIIESWYSKAKTGEFLAIPKICIERHNNEETLYFLHRAFRRKFKNLWTCVENGNFIVKKVSKKDCDFLNATQRLMASLKKPIVGHNVLQDILLIISSFETTLPDSYIEFKKLAHDLFPVIFDTKTLSYKMRDIVAEEKRWDDRSLDTIFDYFKNGTGRNLASNSPAIEMEDEQDNYGKFHDGGWDSFCAGYVFIRLAHLNIYQKYPISKRFVSSEHIGGLVEYKNRINLIRCSVSCINLDGSDPNSTRPPYLVIESLENKPISVSQVTSLLSTFGFIEVRKFPFQKTRALIAVDNYGNARRIMRDFRNDPNFRIAQYNVLRHSPAVKAVLVGGLTVSGALILWLTHSVIKR